MRLFVAIELDETARAGVVSLQRRVIGSLRDDASALRMVRPEQLHLTLVFLGEVSEDRARTLMNALDPPLAGAPYTLTLGGLGMFPPHGAPRVLWLGVVEGAAETIAARAEVLSRLVQAGTPAANGDDSDPHGRAFTPHLTMGRWRDARPRHRRVVAQGEPSGAVAASTRVDTVTLFYRRLGSAGASHTALVRTRLGGA